MTISVVVSSMKALTQTGCRASAALAGESASFRAVVTHRPQARVEPVCDHGLTGAASIGIGGGSRVDLHVRVQRLMEVDHVSTDEPVFRVVKGQVEVPAGGQLKVPGSSGCF